MVHDRNLDSTAPCVSIFPTPLGWFGLVRIDETLRLVTIGHASKQDVWDHVRSRTDVDSDLPEPLVTDWQPELRVRLQRYCRGERVDFQDLEVSLSAFTDFQNRVLQATRHIGYAETQTYGQVAATVGVPGGARAVGNVLAQNSFPILIPCHRVVAANGRLGGFSAPQGVELKRRLLAMENASC